MTWLVCLYAATAKIFVAEPSFINLALHRLLFLLTFIITPLHYICAKYLIVENREAKLQDSKVDNSFICGAVCS